MRHVFSPITLLWMCLIIGLCLTSCEDASQTQGTTSTSMEGHVADLAQLLNPKEIERLEAQLNHYQTETGVSFFLFTTDDSPLAAMSKRLERRVNLSPNGLNASAMILVSLADRQAKIEVNHGLEWQVPDSVSALIFQRMTAGLGDDQYAASFEQAFNELHQQVSNLPFSIQYNQLTKAANAGAEAIGRIVSFSARYEGQPDAGYLTGQFDPAFFLIVRDDQGQSAHLYYSRYMEEMAEQIAHPEAITSIRARVRAVSPTLELDLLSIN